MVEDGGGCDGGSQPPQRRCGAVDLIDHGEKQLADQELAGLASGQLGGTAGSTERVVDVGEGGEPPPRRGIGHGESGRHAGNLRAVGPVPSPFFTSGKAFCRAVLPR